MHPFTGGSREEEAGGSEVARGREVPQVITNPPTGTDGGRGRTLRNSRAKQTNKIRPSVGGKAPQSILAERSHEEALEVPAGDSGSL